MQRGLVTEAEWRKRKTCRRPVWYGAQCVYPRGFKRRLTDRKLHMGMFLLAALLSGVIVCAAAPQAEMVFEDYQVNGEQTIHVRSVSAVGYRLPQDIVCESYTLTGNQLLNGEMLLLDEHHPLPQEMLPPNTVSIAQYGRGMVPVQSLTVRSGYETIDALAALFAQLRAKGVDGFYISQGTMSQNQQKEAMIAMCRQKMLTSTPDKAAIRTREACEWPGTGSLLLEYTVEINHANGLDLDDSVQGQELLQLCWRYGFVRESKPHPNRFRYVGKAHAAAMTYLDLDFKTYLEWLHQQRIITVASGGKIQYLILCTPLQGNYAVFQLPQNAECKLSLDNMGYAIAACTMKAP